MNEDRVAGRRSGRSGRIRQRTAGGGTGWLRLRAVAPVAASALALSAVAVPSIAMAAPKPRPIDCVTPIAADGHEPPCNPHLAQTEWAGSHRGSYAQASSPFPGIEPGQEIEHLHTRVEGVPIAVAFSEPYPGADGRRVVWGSLISAPENQGVFKLDASTGELLDFYSDPTGELSSESSGAYNVLDRDNHLIVAHRRGLDVYGDSVPGNPDSKIKRFSPLDLGGVLCGEDDRVVGITMRYDGTVAFASEFGIVGIVPRQVEQMKPENVRAISINGADCADPAVQEEDEFERISNSISTDEDGGVYVVTSKAQYRFGTDRKGVFGQQWRAEYETGGIVGGARLGEGSGSTPSLMGTSRNDDRFVVITDGQEKMHLVFMWRDQIPKDWQPIAPGKDRRIACEVPVTFGDPNRDAYVSEQSVLIRGNAAVVVDNAHTLDPVTGALPQLARPFSLLGSQFDANAPHGIERLDWNPVTRTCESIWDNTEVSMPNGIPTMSAASGLVYNIGQENNVWGLIGVDFQTGEKKLFVPSGPVPDAVEPNKNSFFAGAAIGPDGSVWSGTLQGVSIFRPSTDQG